MNFWPFRKQEPPAPPTVTIIDVKMIADAMLRIWADYKHKVIMPQLEKETEASLLKMERERVVREKQLGVELKKIIKDIKKHD